MIKLKSCGIEQAKLAKSLSLLLGQLTILPAKVYLNMQLPAPDTLRPGTFPAYIEKIDIAILFQLNSNRNTSLDGIMEFITNLAPTLAFVIPSAILVYFLFKGEKREWLQGLLLVLTVSIPALITTVIKWYFDRPRPFSVYDIFEKLSVAGSPSFPSGHTTDAMAMAIALSLWKPKWYVILPVFTWAFLTAWSRMHLGVHYPSDVLGGAFVGLFFGGLVWWVGKRSFNVTLS